MSSQNGEKMKLEIGTKAPDFTSVNQNGEEIKLSNFKGKWLVLYFYPKDNTSGCTKEACAFRDNMERVKSLGVEVLGVSPDSAKSHKKFIAKHELNFDLLVDIEKTIAGNYGAYGEKKNYGKTYMGIIRSTFLINPDSEIVKTWYNVRVNGHIDKVMAEIENIN